MFSALPKELVAAIAGLALLGAIGTSLSIALTDEISIAGEDKSANENKSRREAALITFLITASGATLFGIGSAFWGLLAGVLVTGLPRAR